MVASARVLDLRRRLLIVGSRNSLHGVLQFQKGRHQGRHRDGITPSASSLRGNSACLAIIRV
jgi:hypothetical protein